MKLFASLTVIFAVLASTSSNAAWRDDVFTDLGRTAPRSVFDDLRDTAPRIVLGQPRDAATVRRASKEGVTLFGE